MASRPTALLFLALVLSLAALPLTPAPAAAESWTLMAPVQPFDDASPTRAVIHRPLERARKPWRLCVLYPHMKDSYWLSVNYGMVEQARALGVSFLLYEAGGYPYLARQRDQARDCARRGMDAMIVGTVSYDGLTPVIREIARKMPVIAAVNDIAPEGIAAKASVPWREMGRAAGRLIAGRHPKGSAPVRIAWFPGPAGAGWVRFVDEGFRAALADSSARIVATRFGDTGREQQVQLVESVLDHEGRLDYLVGSGPMADVAVSILRERGLQGRIGVVSTYMSHAVFRGIQRGRILGAPTDFPVLQGRLAIELAVRAIEGRLDLRHAGPAIVTVTAGNIDRIGSAGSLAPATFVPVFEVDPPG